MPAEVEDVSTVANIKGRKRVRPRVIRTDLVTHPCRDVQALIEVTVFCAVPKKEATVVAIETTRVVVYDVEHDRDAIQVAKVDECLKLCRSVSDIVNCDGAETLLLEQTVDGLQVSEK